MSRSTTIAVVVIVAVVIVGGAVALAVHNSSSSNDTTMNMSPTPTVAGSASNSPSASTTNAVTISDFAFVPGTITVKTGTTVTWTNQDSASHTVVVDSGTGPKSSNIATGKTFSYTFATAGTYAYHCSIHPSMKATVIVTD